MKKSILAFLLSFLLTVPVFAEEQIPETPIQLNLAASSCGIDLKYLLTDDDISSAEIRFANLGCYYAANYNAETGCLKISIASDDVLDLPETIGYVTATLSNGTKVAPQLELVSLRLDGKLAGLSPELDEISVDKAETTLTVSGSLSSIFLEEHITVFAVAYSQKGKMYAVTREDLLFSDGAASLHVTLPYDSNTSTVKMFFASDAFSPVMHCTELKI